MHQKKFYDDLITGAITLVLSTLVSNVVDHTYDKIIVSKRRTNIFVVDPIVAEPVAEG